MGEGKGRIGDGGGRSVLPAWSFHCSKGWVLAMESGLTSWEAFAWHEKVGFWRLFTISGNTRRGRTIPHLCKVGSSNCWELDSEFLVFMGSIRSVMMVGMHLPAYVWVLRLKLPRKWDILSKAWKTAKSDLSNKLAQYQNIITIFDKTWFEYWKYNKLGYESQFSQNCIHILCPCLG